jgi:sugar phosphate isomerase/epimerase
MALGTLSMNMATLNPKAPFHDVIDACSRGGIRAVGALRDQVARVGLSQAGSMLRSRGIEVTSLVRAGPFTANDPVAAQAAIDDARRAIEEAAALDAACLVIFAGGLPAGSKDIGAAREMVRDAVGSILPEARSAGVPLAMEPLHPIYAAERACMNTLEQVLDICDELGTGVGAVVDTYHTWWDPKLSDQIARAGRKGQILGYHISDWLVPTGDMLLDRGMIGDGVIDLKTIGAWIEASGYSGSPEIEIFSASNWWARPADDVIRMCVERFAINC